MEIVLIGAGRMGQGLAGRLIEEGHNLTVVDRVADKLEHISNYLDVMTLQGNGADYETLTEAGAGDADLLLAVTSDDAVNMLCCLTARKLGVKNTVARVRTMEYYRQLVFFKEELGLSLVFNPERDAAAEIPACSASPPPPRSSPSPRAAPRWWSLSSRRTCPSAG